MAISEPENRRNRLRSASLVLAMVIGLLGRCQGNTAEAGEPRVLREFISSHCYDCHQGESAEGDLDLQTLPLNLDDEHVQQRWVRIIDRVAAGEMPPREWGAADVDQRAAFVATIHEALQTHQQSEYAEFGRVRGRRLTRLQVERSLQDLLGIDIPLADRLPEDPKTEGFTTVADGQAMSHFQLSAHLDAVDAALDEAYERVLSPEDTYHRDFDAQGVARTKPERRCREPEMRNGKAVIWSSGLIYYGRIPATTSPRDGWYDFSVTISGLRLPNTGGVWSTVRSGPCVSSAPLLANVTTFEAMEEPKTIEFTAWLPRGHMLEIRPGDDTLKKGRFAGGQVGAGEGESQDLAGIAFDRITMRRVHLNGDDDHVRALLFGHLTLEETADRGKKNKRAQDQQHAFRVVSESPHEDTSRLLTQFASRAFRRPATQEDIAPYIEQVYAALDEGEDLAQALRLGYRALLCSPRFLFLAETPGELDDHAIATRLSFMLTGSTPDSQLIELAAQGDLRDDQVLRQQVRRLLAGDAGRRFVQDFAAEWLDLDQIGFTRPDRKLYPGFDTVVEQAMLSESETYLEIMLRDDLSVRHLIDSDFTFLNSRLARFYEIDGVAGDAVQRVSLGPDSHRGGLLTHGAILKVTANGSNTSPVIRGVWVLERLLGGSVPPPPANVPAVEPDIRGATTIREQLAKHRSLGQCARCHLKIDPPGFALENYDPAGRWRNNYPRLVDNRRKKGAEIDASYTMPDGTGFQDIDGFQSLVNRHPEKLAANLAEKLLTYGTGATIAYADRQAVESIVHQTAENEFGFRSIVEAVVTSPVFLSK